MAESFPAELPNRSLKIAFGKRIYHRFKPRVGKCKRSKSASPVTSDVNSPKTASPGPCAQDGHVRTRRTTSQPASQVLLKARPETLGRKTVEPRRSFSTISLAFPEPHIDYPTTARTPTHDSGLAEEQDGVPTLRRKKPPQLTVRHTLVERLEKIRLPATTHTPLAPAEVASSRSTTNFSFPLQSSNSTKAAKLGRSRMGYSNPGLPGFFQEQPYPRPNHLVANHRCQGENSTDPIVVEDDSSHITALDLDCLTGDFENTNLFESGGLSRQLVNQPQAGPGEVDVRTRCERHDQERKDRLLSGRLQQEYDGYPTIPSYLAETSRSSAPQVTYAETGSLNSLRQNVTQIGAREGPIKLNSDPDVSGTTVSKRAQIQDHVALNEELMERDCVVCSNSFPVGDLPALAECEHQPETCVGCFSGWVTAQLQDSSWRGAKCPRSHCNVELSYYEIQQYADSAMFGQYDAFKFRGALGQDPDFRWCRACDSGQVHTSGREGNIFTCVACGDKACTIHDNAWHEGETCGEFDYRSSCGKKREQKAQEEASLKTIGQTTKKCPGPGCNWNIEKNEGCDHITCTKCGYEFCWVCLCNFNTVRDVGNAAHAITCPYHSSRLP